MAGANKLMTPGGGGVIIQPASSIASDVTVQVPAQNCTLDIQGPAFRAYGNGSQTISNATFTKIALQNKSFDTSNLFDNVTNYRFQPNVAGYFKVTGNVSFVGSTVGTGASWLYKNGSSYASGNAVPNNTNLGACSNVVDLVYMNGTTDYLELYGWQNSGGNLNTQGNAWSETFSATLVRAA